MTTKSNLRLASFDGGGIRSLSQLEIMGHIMYRLKCIKYPDNPGKVMLPCEHFDMIGGSDTGGLIAIMFVKLQMSVDEATAEFGIIVEKAYAKDLAPTERTKRLRGCMEVLLRKRGKPLDLKLEDEGQHSGCVGFALATPGQNTRNQVHLRTYHVRSQRPSGVTVVDAVLASCASQPDFLPASFGIGFRRQEYVGAGVGASNPIQQVITEARLFFGGGSNVSSLLSLGSGHPGIIAFPPSGGIDALREVTLKMMKDCEQKAQETQRMIGWSGIYFRFSVDQGMQQEHAECDELTWIYSQTMSYIDIQDTVDKFEEYLTNASSEVEGATLDQINGIGGLTTAPAPRAGTALGIHCSGGARVVSSSNTFIIRGRNATYAEVKGDGSDFRDDNNFVTLNAVGQ